MMPHSRNNASARAWVSPATRAWRLPRHSPFGPVVLIGLVFVVIAQTATHSLFLQWMPSTTAAQTVGHHLLVQQRPCGTRHLPATPRRNGRESRNSRTVMHAGDKLFTVLAIGAAGSGKSETCNTILGKASFEVSAGMAAATQETSFDTLEEGTTTYRVFDSAGFLDASTSLADIDKRLTPVAAISDSGVDAFLLLFPCGRWGLENNEIYKLFKEKFGQAALRHTVMVFSKCGQIKDEELVREMKQVVPKVLEDVGMLEETGKPPVIAVGELTEERRLDDQKRLLSMVKALSVENNGTQFDDSPIFKQYQATRQDQEMKIKKLPESIRDLMFPILQRVRTGQVTENLLVQKLEEAEYVEAIDDPARRDKERRSLAQELRTIQLSGFGELVANKLGGFVKDSASSVLKDLNIELPGDLLR